MTSDGGPPFCFAVFRIFHSDINPLSASVALI